MTQDQFLMKLMGETREKQHQLQLCSSVKMYVELVNSEIFLLNNFDSKIITEIDWRFYFK